MKVFVVDPFAREITEVEHDGTLESLYRLAQCDTVDVIRVVRGGDVMYVDDNGLFKPFAEQQFFLLDSYDQPLAGRGVVVGVGLAGEDAPPMITLGALKGRIKWLTHEEAARGL